MKRDAHRLPFRTLGLGGIVVGFLSFVCPASCEPPAHPYVDPTQLDVPWPKHSHYKQPWRAFLETRSGNDFLHGIGVNYNVSGNHDLAARLLAEAGFRTFRIEVGWGSVNWEETEIANAERLKALLRLCRQYGIRPTILLNAHHGVPCPARFFERKITADALQGARAVRLDNVAGVEPGRTGLSNLTGYTAAEVFIIDCSGAGGECRLSKPLPKGLKAGERVLLATLKYLPAHPVGAPEFEKTAAGWRRYAELVLNAVKETGTTDFDLELWNELSFGSSFMGGNGINRYYDPPIAEFRGDFLNPGGHAWEIARRTIESAKKTCSGVRCIWGFSNTTFFHTRIERLPAGTDGQSYHPYGTGARKLPEQEYMRDRPETNLEGYTPVLDIRMPEGWAHTFIQTESLMRHLNPSARRIRPQGTERFFHYMTEHGVGPPECGVADTEGAWRLKTVCALRSFCLWLNKGVDVLHYFCAYDREPTGMGLLPADLPKLPSDAKFHEVATPPLKAVRNMTKAFDGSVALKTPRQLEVEAACTGGQGRIFDGDEKYPPLYHSDVLAVLPFQLDERRFVVAVYVMTYDATKSMEPETYRLIIKGLPKGRVKAELFDPIEDVRRPVKVVSGNNRKDVTLDVRVRDYPCLLTLD